MKFLHTLALLLFSAGAASAQQDMSLDVGDGVAIHGMPLMPKGARAYLALNFS